MSEDKSDLTRIEDLGEFIHEASKEVDDALEEPKSRPPQTTLDELEPAEDDTSDQKDFDQENSELEDIEELGDDSSDSSCDKDGHDLHDELEVETSEETLSESNEEVSFTNEGFDDKNPESEESESFDSSEFDSSEFENSEAFDGSEFEDSETFESSEFDDSESSELSDSNSPMDQTFDDVSNDLNLQASGEEHSGPDNELDGLEQAFEQEEEEDFEQKDIGHYSDTTGTELEPDEQAQDNFSIENSDGDTLVQQQEDSEEGTTHTDSSINNSTESDEEPSAFDSTDALENEDYESESGLDNEEQPHKTPKNESLVSPSTEPNYDDPLDLNTNGIAKDKKNLELEKLKNENIQSAKSIFTKTLGSSIRTPSPLRDLNKFHSADSLGGIQLGTNPPYSVLFSEIKYKDEFKEIINELKKYGIINQNNEDIYNNAIITKSLLVPQLGENLAISLANKFKHMRLRVSFGLSEEIFNPKNRSSLEGQRGVPSQHQLYKHSRKSYDFGSNSDVLFFTSDVPEKYEVIKQFGLLHVSKQLPVENLQEKQNKEDSLIDFLTDQIKDKARNNKINAIVDTKIKKEFKPEEGLMFLRVSIYGIGAIVKEQEF
tara:strand:- start:410 stop:2218 length:1809 start_codon:yes stop_codon:yes gene_type:complete